MALCVVDTESLRTDGLVGCQEQQPPSRAAEGIETGVATLLQETAASAAPDHTAHTAVTLGATRLQQHPPLSKTMMAVRGDALSLNSAHTRHRDIRRKPDRQRRTATIILFERDGWKEGNNETVREADCESERSSERHTDRESERCRFSPHHNRYWVQLHVPADITSSGRCC